MIRRQCADASHLPWAAGVSLGSQDRDPKKKTQNSPNLGWVVHGGSIFHFVRPAWGRHIRYSRNVSWVSSLRFGIGTRSINEGFLEDDTKCWTCPHHPIIAGEHMQLVLHVWQCLEVPIPNVSGDTAGTHYNLFWVHMFVCSRCSRIIVGGKI